MSKVNLKATQTAISEPGVGIYTGIRAAVEQRMAAISGRPLRKSGVAA